MSLLPDKRRIEHTERFFYKVSYNNFFPHPPPYHTIYFDTMRQGIPG